LTARYFGLFVYFANWGSRRLSIRLPKRFLDAAGLKRFIGVSQSMAVRTAGENLIIDVFRYEIEIEDHDGDPLLRAELRRRCRVPASPVEDRQARRSAGEQRATARRLNEERRRAEAKRRQAAQRRREQKEAKAKNTRLNALARRSEATWSDVEV
jgi:hypothetical protein